MRLAQVTVFRYEGFRLSELVRPAGKDDNRAFAAASLGLWAEAQNARAKVPVHAEVPSTDLGERLVVGYATGEAQR